MAAAPYEWPRPIIEAPSGFRPLSGRWLTVALGFAGGLLAAAVAIVWLFAGRAPAATVELESTRPAVASELPREWRWQRAVVGFDHMFRNRS